MKNISFIGMPGCGKTTISRLIANKYKMNFVDVDDYIEKNYDLIANLFNKGEEYFREIETKALTECVKMKNTIISTGGGVITRQENIDILKENTLVIFIDRDINNIIKRTNFSNRPLLKNNPKKIYDLYEKRYEKYLQTCDKIVENKDDILKNTLNQVSNIIDKLIGG